jgi:hypothetical protein
MRPRIITRRQASAAIEAAVRRLIWGTVQAIAWLALLAAVLLTSYLLMSL